MPDTKTDARTDAKKRQSDADKAREETTKRTAALAEADADYRAEVKTAGEKRAKALAKFPDGSNVAEQAWNETKDEADPLYAEASLTHRQKLDTVVDSIRRTGTAGVVGLEAFEAEVVKLIKDEKPGTALAVPEGGRPAEPPKTVVHAATADTKKAGK